MNSVTVTKLSPAPQEVFFQDTQFSKENLSSSQQPIDARPTRNGWDSTGISFEDYDRMNVHRRKTANVRRMETPVWAVNEKLLAEVVTTYLERRTGTTALPGAPVRERLAAAQLQLRAKSKIHSATLTRLCQRYVALKNGANPDPKQLRELEVEIENLDTVLRIAERGAGLVLAAVYLYYRANFDSVGVATELGIKPPHVRTLLYRINQTWQRMQQPTTNPSHRPPKVRTIPVGRACDITGQKFGRLTVVARHLSDGGPHWVCKCDCGGMKIVAGGNMKSGMTKSCGCLKSETSRKNSGLRPEVKDITGQRFGRLVAVHKTHMRTPAGNVIWLCRCDCGAQKLASGTAMRYGEPRSCGCLQREAVAQNLRNYHAARKAAGVPAEASPA